MSIITSFKAQKKTYDTVLLTWETNAINTKGTYTLYRRLNDADEYTKIAETNATAYIDKTDLIKYNKEISYKLTGLDEEIVAKIDCHGDNYLYEIVRNFNFRLNECNTGVKSTAYCSSIKPLHCSECWSVAQQKVIKTNCSTCDGSGIINGYIGPVDLYIAYGQGKETIYYDGNASRKRTVYPAWTSNLPILKKDDIIIRGLGGDRYIIVDAPVYLKYVPLDNDAEFIVRQDFYLSSIHPGHFGWGLSNE